ncbi:MAG: hypothetical protein E5W53_02485 [Mesorhizobium sp.]|uniref:hypothetical protein n=1 Tax=unclassified Mesorhizobium TaxID=325217 RepID=UPI000FE5B8C4|nr:MULTISPECIES: hypothetical protein [unclassified Mesorhizobium]RWC22424.1 MAG: hypothetical protein EOS51_10465 [Mesorhizobium sp.]TGT94743.1 hypothetical protein EN807_21600 [Mesorhizobium sp. M5C.F.Ca.ET.164.01.1.1]TIU27576.1 MAG: hypothetical protein E5W53_02485 [Mesorhizobium sp.]
MQHINDAKKLVKQLDERARQSLIRIKETEELIEQNHRLTKRSRGILARAPVLAAALGRTNDRP